MSDKYGNLDHLSVEGKDALISCGEEFAKEAEWVSVLWIIEQLKNDPDPHFPNPMHDEIASGKDYPFIGSVRGRLCWLIQKVVVYNLIKHYSSMLDILEGYAFGRDFYIRSQACVPLSEMAVRRRQKLPNGNRFMPEAIADRIKRIALHMLDGARGNPALLDDVSNILGWIGDLTEEQATVVIDTLSEVSDTDGVHSRCGILLYFSLFREQFPDLPPFNSANFKDRLRGELRTGESKFRTSLIWQMAGGAEDKPYPFEAIEPYLSSFVAGAYCDGAFFNLRRIFDVYVKEHADKLCGIMSGAVERVAEYIAADPQSRGWNVHDLREHLNLIAGNCGEDSVLDVVASMVAYKARIPGLDADLAWILGRHQSVRAQELRARL